MTDTPYGLQGGPIPSPTFWFAMTGGISYTSGGIVVGDPVGGNLGTGTINAVGISINGVALNPAEQMPPSNPGMAGEVLAVQSNGNPAWTAGYATTAFVNANYAPLASPALTGTPTAPTPASNDNSTRLSTTAFVVNQVGNYLPLAGGTVTGIVTINNQLNINNSPVVFQFANYGIWMWSPTTAWFGVGCTPGNQAIIESDIDTSSNNSNKITRWQIWLNDGTAETGSNAGSNFAIANFSDTGVELNQPLQINRASGQININSTLQVASGIFEVNPAAIPASITVTGTGSATATIRAYRYSNDNIGPAFSSSKARGTSAVPLIPSSLDDLGAYGFQTYTGAAYLNTAWFKSTIIEPTPSTTTMGTATTLWNTIIGSTVATLRAWWNYPNLYTVPAGLANMANGIVGQFAAVDNTTSPTGLIIVGAGTNSAQLQLCGFGYSNGGYIVHNTSRGTAAAPTASLTNDVTIYHQGRGWDGTAYRAGSLFYSAIIDPSPSPTSFRSRFYFQSCPTGSGTLQNILVMDDVNCTFTTQNINGPGVNIALGGTGAQLNNITLTSEVTSGANFSTKCAVTSNGFNYFAFYKSRGTVAAPTAVVTNDFGGVIYLGSFYSGSSFINSCYIRSTVIEGTPSATAMGSSLSIFLCPAGSVTAQAALTLTGSATATFGIQTLAVTPPSGGAAINVNAFAGNSSLYLNKNASGVANYLYGQTNSLNRWVFYIGDATAESGSNAGSNFALNAYNDAGTILGSAFTIARSTQIVTFTQAIVNPSDVRWKENIKPITDGLEIVKQLLGVRYTVKGDIEKNVNVGLIAQEVKQVLPEVVKKIDTQIINGEEYENAYGISYPQIVAILIEAVKTLNAKVETLEARLAA